MTYLSDAERRILINQLQILTMLDRKQAKDYEHSLHLLDSASGHADCIKSLRQIAMAGADEPMTFAFRVLSLYSFLQSSFYTLDLKEKIQIDHTALIFPGFDERRERVYSDYVSFIRNNLGQFSLLETRDDERPQAAMAPFYKELLALKVEENDDVLDNTQITGVIETINGLRSRMTQDDAELETASAAA